MSSKLVLILSGTAVAVALAVGFYLLFPSVSRTSSEQGYADVVLTGNEIYGKSLEQWAQAWWNWTVTLPPGDLQTDPETNLNECFLGSDPDRMMVFLFGSYGDTYSTECSISSQEPLLVPLLVGECDATVPDPRTKTGKIEDLWACAQEADEVFKSWDVRLDNRTLFKKDGNEEVNINLKDEILVRNSSIFMIYMPDNNRYEVQPGSYEAVVDGYYLILKPLPPGDHLLKYKIVHELSIPGADLSYSYGDATYLLHVK